MPKYWCDGTKSHQHRVFHYEEGENAQNFDAVQGLAGLAFGKIGNRKREEKPGQNLNDWRYMAIINYGPVPHND
ncbi:hypothetical protein SS1G_12780 [Sclerotinia sclerotiorum 1980 UF-70]|uniref:Uncharacterized protein n=1 Tax=Sclerotinia sclerotiorum (strain ATCC 18683 / 1980 / Ss-1) TaxID=665079 RepID=A7F5A4_SCLS1|nr:hypothetical protein SS1G_12780 [Sclerotinia sclerotiorum 1980 UF-70]EDN97925.1 hypothetical protein SS1G_12780 [Sclerotinia sclerotiorum 1980 UF-70]